MRKPLDKKLPHLPGVYIFKDKDQSILYIGKAKSLKDRVASYFHKHNDDWKVLMLIEEYDELDFIITHTETEAGLLEAQLIKAHQPKYNVLLKTGQPFIYILFTKGDVPTIELVRNKKKKGSYFGPLIQKRQARKVYQYLMRTFKLNRCNKKLDNGCLDYHLGNCAGSCKKDFDRDAYLFRLELAQDALKKNHASFMKNIRAKIAEYSSQMAFEKAKKLVDYLENIDAIFHTLETHYSETKYDNEVFAATARTPYSTDDPIALAHELKDFFKTDHLIRTIDCFDISHFQSRYIVGSCVRFIDGKPDKNSFRRFKIKTLTEQDDYAALREIVERRYKNSDVIPDLVLIDGGKGQLNTIQQLLPNVYCASLAKREETIYSNILPEGVRLNIQTNVGKLLIALRDYAHHFAVSYHTLRRNKNLRDDSSSS
jgi:excinuclease ABC subunit C